jgi:hypothetical protein
MLGFLGKRQLTRLSRFGAIVLIGLCLGAPTTGQAEQLGCIDTSDCPPGYACVGGRCEPDDPPGCTWIECSPEGPCPTHMICVDGCCVFRA